jgi:hypothetical protein
MTLSKRRLLLRHFRDVTLTPARITGITLSRMTLGMTLGKCRMLQRDVALTPARITDITLSRMTCPGSHCVPSIRHEMVAEEK